MSVYNETSIIELFSVFLFNNIELIPSTYTSVLIKCVLFQLITSSLIECNEPN